MTRGGDGVPALRVGVDIGGTFTDLIGFNDETQAFVQAKSLTTPAELTQGVINCIRVTNCTRGTLVSLAFSPLVVATGAIHSPSYFIDKKGRAALRLKWNIRWPFSDGLTVVGEHRKQVYVDRRGTIVAPYEIGPQW